MKTMAALVAMAALSWAGETRDEAVRKLETLKISVDFQDVKLPDAVDYLREVTGMNLVMLPRALEKESDAVLRLKVKDLTVKSVLKLMLGSRGLTAAYRDGAIVILPKDDLQDSTVMRMFDVRSMMVKLQDFPGPKVELAGKETKGPAIGGVFNLEEPKPPPIEEDFLLQLIREHTGGQAAWDSNRNAGMQMSNGIITVSQTPSVLREIESLLGLLGQYR